MSNVPYVFANNTGNIPLSELDANFSNVKASVDFAVVAGQATLATLANTVVLNAQPNITSVGTLGNLTVSGQINVDSINVANINSTGAVNTVLVSAIGNVAGAYFIGDGSQLTNLPSLNYSNANVGAYLTTYTGDISAGNVGASGNVVSGNILTSGVVSATGNVRGSNLNTVGQVSATGNVLTAGLISATGNITGGNFNTSGNITASNYILGNVALADGLPAIYNDSNVVSLLSSFGSNVVNTTGNIYGGNTSVDGLMSATGNVVGNNLVTLGIASSGSVETTNIIATDIEGSQIIGPAFLSYTDITTYPPTPVDKVVIGTNGVIKYDGLEQYVINYIRITANATSANLSTTTSTNIIQANNTGYTATINFPDAYPVTEGTVIKFTVAGGNAVTLIGNAGPTVISPSFDGLTAPGTGYTYMLVNEPFISSYWARVV